MSAETGLTWPHDALDAFDALTLELHDVECLADLLDALGTAPVGDGASGIAKGPLLAGIGAIGRVMLEKSQRIRASAGALRRARSEGGEA